MSELETETAADRVDASTEETVENESVGKQIVRKWLNKSFRIEMTDGRVLVGIFLCTDRDANIILGSCSEYLKDGETTGEEPRILGLVMVPGRHIVSIEFDENYIAPNLPNE